jgi:hypothetical protein
MNEMVEMKIMEIPQTMKLELKVMMVELTKKVEMKRKSLEEKGKVVTQAEKGKAHLSN